MCKEGGGDCGLDWQPTGYSCHNILCIPSLCVQWAAERITVKWDDINYPNPDSSLWNSASTHRSQERTWMVRQRECQRNEMKADKFSREYSQQKHCSLNKVDLLLRLLSFAFLFMISWSLNCRFISNIPLSSCNWEFFFASLNILIWKKHQISLLIHDFIYFLTKLILLPNFLLLWLNIHTLSRAAFCNYYLYIVKFILW